MTSDPDQAVSKRAGELLALSGNCAQSSFAALAEHLGLQAEHTLKALTPFPGIGLRGDTCGAVTGCVMAIGMVLGRDRLDDAPGMEPSLRATRRFCRTFKTEFGGTSCRVVLEQGLGSWFDLARLEAAAAYVDAGGPEYCSRVVTRAVLLALQALEDAAPER